MGDRLSFVYLERCVVHRDSSAIAAQDVDMYTVVLVGSSVSRAVAGRFVTPRGTTWRSAAETVP